MRLRILSTAVLALGVVVGSAAPALAHARAVSTQPANGSNVHRGLTQVSVTFDEAVTLVPHALRVTTDMGMPVALESPRLSHNGTVLSARIQDRLASGRYAVAWRVQADDGHLESSTFAFTVAGAGATAAAAALPDAPPAPGEPLWPVLIAAAIAAVGGIGAGFTVRRGLRLALPAPTEPYGHDLSPSNHETLRLPM